MKDYIKDLSNRKLELSTAIKAAETYLKHAPEGKIRVTRGGTGYTDFFHVTSESGPNGQYIKKQNTYLTESLIQKEYAAQFLKCAKRELLMIDKYLKYICNSSPENAIKKLNVNKRKMVKPYLLDDIAFAEKWLSQSYITSSAFPEKKKFPTKKGDMVRSKSEAMIADVYYELGIPYRYECQLKLKDGKIKSPDFTILDVKRRRLVYHEHMGRLDKEDYRTSNLTKISDYMSNGINSCNNLLLTFESEEVAFNIMDFRNMVKELFL